MRINTISNRVVLLGIVPLFLLLVVLFLSFFISQQKDQLFNQLYDEHLAILSGVMQSQKITQQLALAEIRQYKGGWVSGEAVQQSINSLLTEAEQHWQHFSSSRVSRSDEVAEHYEQLDTAFNQAISHYQEWIAPFGDDALYVRILNDSTINNEFITKIQPFGELSGQFIEQQLTKAEIVRDQAEALTQQWLTFYVLGGGLITCFILLFIWFTRQNIYHNLSQLKQSLIEIEQQADLTQRVNEQGLQEVAAAAKAVNVMLERFLRLLLKITSDANQLQVQGELMARNSEQLTQSVQLQSTEAHHVVNNIKLMISNLAEVRQFNEQADHVAQQAAQLCLSGRSVSEGSMQSAETLAQQLSTATTVIGELQQGSAQISGVLEVIGQISEQTNLLALNAAIEAARAGEAGRGFSVVADEVRTLSGNTKAATESIRQMIGLLQQQANSAVQSITEANMQASQSVTQARDTKQMFGQLASEVQVLAQLNQQILQAGTTQLQSADHCLKGVEQMQHASDQLQLTAGQAAQVAEQLNSLAASLELGMRQFKTQ